MSSPDTFRLDFDLTGAVNECLNLVLPPDEQIRARPRNIVVQPPHVSARPPHRKGILSSIGQMVLGSTPHTHVISNDGDVDARLLLSGLYPGTVLPLQLSKMSGGLLYNQRLFLAATPDVSSDAVFQAQLADRLLQSEAFILREAAGDGLLFLHIGGSLFQENLESDESIQVRTDSIAAFTDTISFDVVSRGGVARTILGGDDQSMVLLSGPGRAYLQNLPPARLPASTDPSSSSEKWQSSS